MHQNISRMDYGVVNELLKEKGVSMRAASLGIGLSHTAIDNMLRRKTFKVDNLERLAEFLHIPIWRFFQVRPTEQIENEEQVPIICTTCHEKERLIKMQGEMIEMLKFQNEIFRKGKIPV